VAATSAPRRTSSAATPITILNLAWPNLSAKPLLASYAAAGLQMMQALPSQVVREAHPLAPHGDRQLGALFVVVFSGGGRSPTVFAGSFIH